MLANTATLYHQYTLSRRKNGALYYCHNLVRCQLMFMNFGSHTIWELYDFCGNNMVPVTVLRCKTCLLAITDNALATNKWTNIQKTIYTTAPQHYQVITTLNWNTNTPCPKLSDIDTTIHIIVSEYDIILCSDFFITMLWSTTIEVILQLSTI